MLKSVLLTPLKLLAAGGRAVEMAFPTIFHPEQILSKSPKLKRLYDFTVREAHNALGATEHFKKELDDIIKTYNLEDPNRVRVFLELLEFPYYNKRFPTKEEIAMYPSDIRKAVMEHLGRISDPIYKLAKKHDPDIGYIEGYFTHFPIKWQRTNILDEIKRLETLKKATTDPTILQSLENELAILKHKLQKISHVDEQMKALRYQQLPTGGRFGPLDESRTAKRHLDYKMDYRDVMEEYIEGAMRKIFLDRYMPTAKLFFEKYLTDPKRKIKIPNPFYEENDALRQYAFDYVTAQRGALALRRRIFLNESLAQIFPDPESGYRNIAKAVDFATRFQYLAKIGLSWFRFPIVNATQTLLTLYPVVGEKTYMKAVARALTDPTIWKEARDAGVIFEATLRKGLAEALGRHPHITKWEKGLSWPAKFSEQLNRVVSYAAGKIQGAEKGLEGRDLIDHAVNIVNRTQFIYRREALPLIMSTSPAGRLIFQFRTFTANYVNYLIHLAREKNWPAFGRAIGTLATLSGSSALPFGTWDRMRELLLRKGVGDIGEFNPVEFTSEMFGISPPVNFGKSLEPFNIPHDVSELFGPTIGPILRIAFGPARTPEDRERKFMRFIESISPPITAMVKGFSPVVRTDPTPTYPKGRVIGERSRLEQFFLRPPLESTRRKYIMLIASARAGGRNKDAAELMRKARELGVKFGEEDLRQIEALATELRGGR